MSYSNMRSLSLLQLHLNSSATWDKLLEYQQGLSISNSCNFI